MLSDLTRLKNDFALPPSSFFLLFLFLLLFFSSSLPLSTGTLINSFDGSTATTTVGVHTQYGVTLDATTNLQFLRPGTGDATATLLLTVPKDEIGSVSSYSSDILVSGGDSVIFSSSDNLVITSTVATHTVQASSITTATANPTTTIAVASPAASSYIWLPQHNLTLSTRQRVVPFIDVKSATVLWRCTLKEGSTEFWTVGEGATILQSNSAGAVISSSTLEVALVGSACVTKTDGTNADCGNVVNPTTTTCAAATTSGNGNSVANDCVFTAGLNSTELVLRKFVG